MKVLHLSTYDSYGGAGRAAYRLVKGMRMLDIDAKMIVQIKEKEDEFIIGPRTKIRKAASLTRPMLDRIPLAFYKNRKYVNFTAAYIPSRIMTGLKKFNQDITHLHWVGEGFLRIESLRQSRTPVVWTLHDMWAFTGGCHYDDDCGRYAESCGKCPVLGSGSLYDLSYCCLRRKKNSWGDLDLTLVSPSHWLADCARRSALFKDRRIEVIHNGIDTAVYKPMDKYFSRSVFDLPPEKKLILFGAMNATSDKRKGFAYLWEAMQSLSRRTDGSHELVIVGGGDSSQLNKTRIKSHFIGKLSDDVSMALLYSAADVFVAPSLQENLANTVVEALACGLPCVAFDIGGMRDMIDHMQNGYLARPYESDDLANGIEWVLASRSEAWRQFSHNAVNKATTCFNLTSQANKYQVLYEDIVSRKDASGVICR